MPEVRPRRPRRKHKYPVFGGAPMYMTGYDATGVYGMVPMQKRHGRSPKRRPHSPHRHHRDKSPQRSREHKKHRRREHRVYANFPAPVIVAPQPVMPRQPVLVPRPVIAAPRLVPKPVAVHKPVVRVPVVHAPVVQAPLVQAPVALSEPIYQQKVAPPGQINKHYVQYLRPVNYQNSNPKFQKKVKASSVINGGHADDAYELGPLFTKSGTLRDTQSEIYGWHVAAKKQPSRLVTSGGEDQNHSVYRVLHQT